jgi:anti-sigma regulatory factor (Ser/Thr protein kinase)
MPARASAVGRLRHRAADFAAAAAAPQEVVERVAFAVSEAVTNAVLHAYDTEEGEVRVECRADAERIIVEVSDDGVGIAPRRDSPGIGHGLTIIGALAQTLDIATGPAGGGTTVSMGFGLVPEPNSPPGLEALCRLALETVADVSCVDLVRDGVLRRIAAEVDREPRLTEWLRAAMPPAKPGTATWAALREGGARLVVHDPSSPRSPGGPGEQLGLTWWVAVSLRSGDGGPEALWGFGGREHNRDVPPEAVIRKVSDAARGDLAQPAERAILRSQLVADLR